MSNTIKMSELISIGIKYFVVDTGTTYMLFNDGTEVWYEHIEGCYSEYTPWEDDNFCCLRAGKYFDVLDDLKLPVKPAPNWNSCFRR